MPSTIEARTLSPINSTPRNSPAVEGFEGGQASGKRPPLPVGRESQIKRERERCHRGSTRDRDTNGFFEYNQSPYTVTPRNSPAVGGFEGDETSGERPPSPAGREAQTERERERRCGALERERERDAVTDG